MTAYLDHGATTPLRPAVLAAMEPWLTEHFGNPSGSHAVARHAKQAVEESRDLLAEVLGCRAAEIVFTSGGTEADNLAILGARNDGTVVCSAIEHDAVLAAARSVGHRIVGVTPSGLVDLDSLADVLDDSVRVVSLMLVNNEVGTIQPLATAADLVLAKAPNAVLHTDAVAAFPWLDVAALAAPASLVSVTAHKFGGPKGVGTLVVRDVDLSARQIGGGQERGLRSGTLNVAGIVGMAATARITADTRSATAPRVARLRDRLADGLLETVPGCAETVDRSIQVPGNCHLRFDGIENESLLFLLDEAGMSASAGSACASGAMEPSHVLTAMGLSRADALSSVRFTLGHTTTEDEVDLALKAVPDAVSRLEGCVIRVLSAMSGGVDSSVATAMLLEEGHDVTGVTLKLWGGESDSGCCSVSDVEDTRRVAQQLGVAHHIFNFGEDFDRDVVDLYVTEHTAARTPNPCIECNRSIKFDRLLERARALEFDALATGHHATVITDSSGIRRVGRGADQRKDQSYVLHMLGQDQLASTLFPVGSITKTEVRARAAALGLRTAQKAESQEVCFIAGGTAGRHTFLGDRIALTPARVLDTAGNSLGQVPARELVTIGQRRGLGIGGQGEPRYVVDIDPADGTITLGDPADLFTSETSLGAISWSADPLPEGTHALAQTTAHGATAAGRFVGGSFTWDAPRPRVAPGQSVVLYDLTDQFVLGGWRPPPERGGRVPQRRRLPLRGDWG